MKLTRWPLHTLPDQLRLDGLEFKRIPARPGAMGEYEEVRGNKRVFVVFRDGALFYNYDEKRQDIAWNL